METRYRNLQTLPTFASGSFLHIIINMKIVVVDSRDIVRDTLFNRIREQIEKNIPVLFLVSGGSTAKISVAVCSKLQEAFKNDKHRLKWLLTLSLIDERFGPVGHQDSNWQLLIDLGLAQENFSFRTVSFETAITGFNEFLKSAVEKKENGELYITGLFGIGADGHTAGILPGSPLCKETAPELQLFAAGYKSALFARISIIPTFFQYIDYAVAYAAGPEKRTAIASLEYDMPIDKQPAQLLKRAKETIVFTDAATAL